MRFLATIGALAIAVGFGASLYHRGIAKRGRRVIVGVAIDRRGPHLGQSPCNGGGVLGGARNAIIPAEEKGRTGNADHDCQSADCRQEAHASLQSSVAALIEFNDLSEE